MSKRDSNQPLNIPIRTVIIMYGETVSSQTILQQIERAGRRGLDTQGNIIINPIKEITMSKFLRINPYSDKKYFTRSKSEKYLEQLYTINAEKPVNVKLVCYIPYNINKNLSTLMPFLNKQLGSLTGISHTDSRYFFRLILWLYDVFGPVSQFKYSDDIYHHFIHNIVPGTREQ